MWLIRVVVSLLAAPQIQFADVGNGWPYNALWYHKLLSISCHFRDCKALLVTFDGLTYVNKSLYLDKGER